MEPRLRELAEWIDERLAQREPVPEVLERMPELTTDDAYRVQFDRMSRAVARGDRIVGYKAALTSKAMQAQAGIDEPLLGTLLASRVFDGDAPLSLGRFLRPTLEPEIAVVLGRDLHGPGVTALDAMAAVAGVLPAVEIGDYTMADGARSQQMSHACNTFNGGIVAGPPLSALHGLDLRLEGMTMWHNGAIVGTATGAAVLGDPLASVAFMANKLGEFGGTLRAGMVLLTGSIVASIPLAPGDHVRVAFTRLGELSLHCTA